MVEDLMLKNLAMVIALVFILEVLKKIVPLKLIEPLAVVLGILGTSVQGGFSLDTVINGVIIGFASCKSYDKILDIAFNKMDRDEGEDI